MSKVTDAQVAAIKALFKTGDTLTEQNFADLIDLIADAAEDHEHVSGGGPGSGTGDAAPIQDATESAKGIVELATVAEAQAGTDTTRAVTPAGLLMRKTGTAIIGGDMTGNARGDVAVDIQSKRVGSDEVASGAQAVALGYRNKASATTGIAVGYQNEATGGGADVAVGCGNKASGGTSAAMGNENVASGGNSTASGYSNTASGYYGSALGALNTASGDYSTAVGYNNTASGPHSMAVGSGNQATAPVAYAIGYSNTANVVGGLAVGYANTASGYYGVAVGYQNTASGMAAAAIGLENSASQQAAIAIGRSNAASGVASVAAGYSNTARGNYSSAIGSNCQASAANSAAFGRNARARIEKTTNICGPQIIRKDDGEAAGTAFESFCGVEVVLMSKEVDLTAVADQTITLPSGCRFWIDEIGVIATNIAGLTTQPTVRFGITGDLDKHRAATITTLLTATGKREKHDPLVPEDGETSLTAGVTVAAAGTTVLGRFYWKGMLVENE